MGTSRKPFAFCSDQDGAIARFLEMSRRVQRVYRVHDAIHERFAAGEMNAKRDIRTPRLMTVGVLRVECHFE